LGAKAQGAPACRGASGTSQGVSGQLSYNFQRRENPSCHTPLAASRARPPPQARPSPRPEGGRRSARPTPARGVAASRVKTKRTKLSFRRRRRTWHRWPPRRQRRNESKGARSQRAAPPQTAFHAASASRSQGGRRRVEPPPQGLVARSRLCQRRPSVRRSAPSGLAATHPAARRRRPSLRERRRRVDARRCRSGLVVRRAKLGVVIV